MTVLAVVAAAWWRWFTWPSFVAPGDALGFVMDREGLLPDGAAWRCSGRAWAVRVFGVRSLAEQDRVADAACRATRRRGGPRRFDTLEIEFWSGEPPPDANASTEPEIPGRALVRTVEIR